MTDKKLLTSALRQAGAILRNHRLLGSPNPAKTIDELIDLLDAPELLAAVERVEKGRERE